MRLCLRITSKYVCILGYYELLQEFDLFKPEFNELKTIKDSTDEATDSAANDSPDSEPEKLLD